MALAEATVRAAARGLAADVVAAEVLAAFADRQISSLLLRGPAFQRWLFSPDEVRGYVDVDLLVCPADQARAEPVLRGLGFSPLVEESELRGHRPLHATEWMRAEGVSVDVHETVSGADAPPEVVWDALRAHAVVLEVGGVEARIPDAAGVALLVALHAAHHGVGLERCKADLRRALGRLSEQAWRDAAELADQIGATPAFAAGLSVDSRGRELAARLGLPSKRPVDVELRASSPPPLALGLEWLARTPGVRAKTGLVVRTAFPTPGAMRAWRSRARRGRRGLAVSYVTHPFWLARHLPSSALALRRARRASA
jgi:hypothetical protein